MSVTLQSCRVTILVKALPQPSKTHGETVCCAGVTRDRHWKRLFPIRFRHLKDGSSFGRWDWVDFRYSRPPRDHRKESCRVFEDSIEQVGSLPRAERQALLAPLIRPSINDAISRGESLALIRPEKTRFYHKRKSATDISNEREAFAKAAKQPSFLDEDLVALEPSPFEFRFEFEDDVKHDFRSGDWEVHAMFFNALRRGKSEKEALDWIDEVFNVNYPRDGMVFAVGNQWKRPQTWQLLGVLRLDEADQTAMPF